MRLKEDGREFSMSARGEKKHRERVREREEIKDEDSINLN